MANHDLTYDYFRSFKGKNWSRYAFTDHLYELCSVQNLFKENHSVANGCPNLMTLHFCGANLSYEDLYVILENFPKLEDLNVSHNGFVALPKCIKGSFHLNSLDESLGNSRTSLKPSESRCKTLSVLNFRGMKHTIYEYVDANTLMCFVVTGLRRDPKNTRRYLNCLTAFALKRLFVDGREICGRDYHYFNIGEDHLLLYDVQVLFRDEEWQGLDASLGDDWKAIQVQYDSDLILSNWGSLCVLARNKYG
ncbi:hypothetical protein CR513_50985, partial [Mucuna pruriens]